MIREISRRKFLKVSAGTAGAAAVSGPALGQLAQPIRRTGLLDGPVEKTATYCDICFWKCGALASTRGGQLWKIEGHPEDPLSRGRLCPRGTGGIGLYRDPSRIRSPLMRKKDRGGEQWVEVTWEEALGFIAEKMRKIKADYGPESMALFSHGIGGTFLKHTLKAYGTSNLTAPSFAQCRGPRDVGFTLTFGDEVSSPERTDIAHTDCLVLIGSHLGENMHNTQVQEFADAVERGATIIVVDPRFSVAAGKAKHYLPIKPGTDIALLLAWMNVLVAEDLYDRAYVEEHGFGFDAFKASIAPFTPEWAFTETTIEPELIRTTAREMARARPATCVHPGRHVTWYGDDAQRSRAIALLNALLGSWGRKGGFFMPTGPDVPAYSGYPEYPKSDRPMADNPGGKHPFAHSTISTGIRDATLSGNPYPIKGWMVYATNLIHALPNEEETLKAIQNLDLLVVIDVIGSEIAGWADVILPESIYLERYDDLHLGWFREPFIGIRQPVVESPDDQKPNWWIARELAVKLGLGAYYPWTDIEQYLDHRLRAAGHSLAELKTKGIIRKPGSPIYFGEGLAPYFDTPSGKIEFYSNALKEAGFDPVPAYTRPDAPPPGFYRLLFGRAPVHSFSRTQSNPLLQDMMPENEVWVNADVARRLGLVNGERVRLRNQDGALSDPIRVKATQMIRPDCVYMVHGFGHSSHLMPTARGKGASDAGLITRYATDPLMGGTGMNVNFVTFAFEEA